MAFEDFFPPRRVPTLTEVVPKATPETPPEMAPKVVPRRADAELAPPGLLVPAPKAGGAPARVAPPAPVAATASVASAAPAAPRVAAPAPAPAAAVTAETVTAAVMRQLAPELDRLITEAVARALHEQMLGFNLRARKAVTDAVSGAVTRCLAQGQPGANAGKPPA